MVQFCLRLHFGIDIVSRRLLQWIARIENVLKRKPTTRYRAHSNQISTLWDWFKYWKWRRRWLWSSLWQDMHDQVREDQYEIMTGASGSTRLVSYWWLYDLKQKSVNRGLYNSYRLPIFTTSVRWLCYSLYFQLLVNCTSGGDYVNSCKFIPWF